MCTSVTHDKLEEEKWHKMREKMDVQCKREQAVKVVKNPKNELIPHRHYHMLLLMLTAKQVTSPCQQQCHFPRQGNDEFGHY